MGFIGTTPKPLTFLVHPDLADWEEIKVLKVRKHTVLTTPPMKPTGEMDWGKVDVILAPRARIMNHFLRKYLTLAIEEARKDRYPRTPTLKEAK